MSTKRLYYVLAETDVNGKLEIQDSSETYSASASALASANTSFKDAAKVATIDSNAAAIVAARKTVDDILIKYAYVLADINITQMINNSLKTTIHPIIPVLLRNIASTNDGINYVLNKSRIIGEYQRLVIPFGNTLYTPPDLELTNYGYIQIGGEIDSDGNETYKQNLKDSSTFQASYTLSMNCNGTSNPTSGYVLIGSDDTTQTLGQLIITGPTTTTCTTAPTFTNSGTIILNSGGKLVNQGCFFKNSGSGTLTTNTGAVGVYSSRYST
jgi:hypothetical protein